MPIWLPGNRSRVRDQLAGRGVDDDVVLNVDLDAVHIEFRCHDRARPGPSDDAQVAAGPSSKFQGIVQVEPDESLTHSVRSLESGPQVMKRVRDLDLTIVCHQRP
jgi:hypothetical protein